MRKAAFVMALTVTVVAVSFVGGTARSQTAASLADVQKISCDDLNAQLGNPDLVILDVRTNHDWEASETKIKGAIRADFYNPSAWVDKYPKDKTIVFYCK
jgi:hypothetical protein